ncbi:MAG: MFS transporter [Desulfobacula sp.]|jgi:MFS family permease|nr:MFS transporter [Desulfobacula sp.]MBT6340872.1 MFS transporter [Desulfobacula sp.]
MKYILRDRNLSILFVSTFLFFTNEALFLPTLPLYLSGAGYSNTMIGIVLGAFALGVLLARPLSGFITDEKGRKISLVAGVIIFAAAPLLYLVSTDFLYLIIIRFFHGLGLCFYTTAFPAYITDVSDENNRGEILGHMATSTTLAFTLGPLVGMTVFSSYGFKSLIFLCTITGLLNLIVILKISEIHKKTDKRLKIPYKKIVFKRSVLVSSFIQLIYAIIFGGIMTFLPLLLKNIEGVNVGVFFMVESIVIIACRFIAAQMADKYGRGPVFVYSFLIIICGVYLISKIDTIHILIATAALFGVGSSLCLPALSAYIADRSDPSARGTVFSFFYGAFDAGVVVAGVLLGFIADLTGLREMFMITAASGFLCLIIFSLFIKKGFRKSLQWSLLPKRQ